jgi:hypothetical protein
VDAKGWRSGLMVSAAVALLGVSTAATALIARADEARSIPRAPAAGISSSALKPGDVPAGYGKPQTKVFAGYVSGMKLGTSTCHVRPPITRSSWRGGLISESRICRAGKTGCFTQWPCPHRLGDQWTPVKRPASSFNR